jgi:hypothetical protein
MHAATVLCVVHVMQACMLCMQRLCNVLCMYGHVLLFNGTGKTQLAESNGKTAWRAA